MDGLEWKRDKYSIMTKFFLRFAERLAIQVKAVLRSQSNFRDTKPYLVEPVGTAKFGSSSGSSIVPLIIL